MDWRRWMSGGVGGVVVGSGTSKVQGHPAHSSMQGAVQADWSTARCLTVRVCGGGAGVCRWRGGWWDAAAVMG